MEGRPPGVKHGRGKKGRRGWRMRRHLGTSAASGKKSIVLYSLLASACQVHPSIPCLVLYQGCIYPDNPVIKYYVSMHSRQGGKICTPLPPRAFPPRRPSVDSPFYPLPIRGKAGRGGGRPRVIPGEYTKRKLPANRGRCSWGDNMNRQCHKYLPGGEAGRLGVV